MANVLITGATGFIGFHLASRLVAEGSTVSCLVRPTSDVERLRRMNVRLIRGDVTDQESISQAVAGQDTVFHVAGLTKTMDPVDYFRINGLGARNVARACAQRTTPPVLVTVSSLAATGPAWENRPRVESDEPHPVSFYGRSKLAGERAVRQFARWAPISIVRPPIVIGEADRTGLALFQTVARFGVHLVPCMIRRPRHSVIHADDLCELLLLAADKGKRILPTGKHPDRPLDPARQAQGTYFAASEIDPTYSELGRMLGEAVGRRHVVRVPAMRSIVWLVAGAGEVVSRIRNQPVYLDIDKAREATAGSWLCSAQAAADELGYHVGAPLSDRLAQTAEWYRKEGWL